MDGENWWMRSIKHLGRQRYGSQLYEIILNENLIFSYGMGSAWDLNIFANRSNCPVYSLSHVFICFLTSRIIVIIELNQNGDRPPPPATGKELWDELPWKDQWIIVSVQIHMSRVHTLSWGRSIQNSARGQDTGLWLVVYCDETIPEVQPIFLGTYL